MAPSLRCTVASVLIFLLLLLLPLARPAQAQYAVYDAANWVENFQQALRSLLAIYQRYEQIRQLYDQLRWMAKQLEQLEDPSGREIASLLYYLSVLVRQGEALAYSLDDLSKRFTDLYRGSESVEHVTDEHRRQARAAIDTVHSVLLASQRLARNFVSSQQTLGAMKAQLLRAEGDREVSQAAGLIAAFSAEETSKVTQQLTLLTNLLAVTELHTINRDAMTEATATAAFRRAYRPPPLYNPNRGWTLVPANYPGRLP